MNYIKRGELLAKLRKEAGYTQRSLANALFVSDKAISKWERGLCMPDSTLLTKLSMLLDVDIEHLISGLNPYGDEKIYGEIRCNDLDYSIAGKPLIYYLISYLMLVGIKDISITTNKKNFLSDSDFCQYGLNISFGSCFHNKKTIVIYDKFFLFGANITRYFHSFLASRTNIIPVLDGNDIPIIFTDKPQFGIEWHKNKCERKNLGRGITYIPLSNEEEINDVSKYVSIYEKYHKKKIADLKEIARNRGLV